VAHLTHDSSSSHAAALVVIGGGMMGTAIVGGLVERGGVSADLVTVVEPNQPKRDDLQKRFGVRTVGSIHEAPAADAVVILAIKPQVMAGILPDVAAHFIAPLVVSIAAGVGTQQIESYFGGPAPVVRVMPNVAALAGEGMSLVSAGQHASGTDVQRAVDIFEPLGKVVTIPESQQNIGTAISGSGPAYFGLLADALADAGVRRGLDPEVARLLAVQTAAGAGKLLGEMAIPPQDLIEQVSSPGGTTVAALGALREAGFEQAVHEAVDAAVLRAEELGGSKGV